MRRQDLLILRSKRSSSRSELTWEAQQLGHSPHLCALRASYGARSSRRPIYYVVVVNPSVPAKTIPEFITYAKSYPGKINMASAGTGTGPVELPPFNRTQGYCD